MEKVKDMIRIRGEIKRLLKDNKKYRRETYSDIIERLIKNEGKIR